MLSLTQFHLLGNTRQDALSNLMDLVARLEAATGKTKERKMK